MISRIEWWTQKDIFEQIDLCFGSGVFDWIKIGITPSMGMAAAIIDHIWQHNPRARIVLDPVIRASSGKDFWGGGSPDEWEELAARCYLLTPNWEEIGWLYPGEDIQERCAALTRQQSRPYLSEGRA